MSSIVCRAAIQLPVYTKVKAMNKKQVNAITNGISVIAECYARIAIIENLPHEERRARLARSHSIKAIKAAKREIAGALQS